MTGNNRLSDAEKADGWQLLFDGKTTNGWHNYGNKPIGKAWKVKDGVLYLDTTHKKDWQIEGGGDIISDEAFSNFDLKLEWNIAKNGNSGIIFYIHEDKSKYDYPWQTGPEMQILDNDGHPDAKYPKHRAGDLYDLIAVSHENVKPPGQWNAAEIKCLNGHLELFLNGEKVVSTTMWNDDWKKLVAGSKFKSMPDFGIYKTGRIGLQDHGATVQFRNIKIKRL
ncbi:MAG: DUF1080 domain-containing protein [Chitinophagaceae bacterium]|nr:DUF1080 domain-containing protein [Chitinophagaceae bacterium]MCB0740454.1 DUF1080 domain-containing protein [Chitinophagaceae bacterium]